MDFIFFKRLFLFLFFIIYVGVLSAQQTETVQHEVAKYEAELAKYPRNQSLYYKLATIYQEDNDVESVNRIYKKMLKNWANSANVYSRWGTSLYLMQRYHQAQRNYLTSLKIDPSQADVYYNLYVISMKQEKPDKALKAIIQATRIEPNNENYKNARKELLLLIKQNAKTENIKEVTLNTNVINYYNTSIAYYKKGEYANALESVNNALEIDNMHILSLFVKGNIYMNLNDYENAYYIFSEVVKIYPQYYEAHFQIGYIHSSNYEFDKAFDSYIIAATDSRCFEESINNCDQILDFLEKQDKTLYKKKRKLFVQFLKKNNNPKITLVREKYQI